MHIRVNSKPLMGTMRMTASLASPASPLEIGSLKSDIFSQVLLSIFRGDLPTGTRLKVQHLAAQFGVSSTPVREAIVDLAGLGVVELSTNRGASVAPFGIKEVREIYHVRKLLEAESARLACQSVDLSEIEAVYEQTLAIQSAPRDERWVAACVAIDHRMHRAIVVASGSSRLKAELDRYDRLMHIIRVLLKGRERYLDQILEEHLVVLRAVLMREEEAASRAMALHLDATCNRVAEGLFQE